jgi:hypothetical protein
VKRQSLMLLFVVATMAISLSASPIPFGAFLSGPAESPPNDSPGTGFTFVTIDPVAHTLSVSVEFSGLVAPTTASHIHVVSPPNPTGPVATTVPTFPGFPLGVMAGTYTRTLDTLSADTYNPDFLNSIMLMGNVSAAEKLLFTSIAEGNAYLNIHSEEFPRGEIRGFLAPVPESGTLALSAAALAALSWIRRRRSRA